ATGPRVRALLRRHRRPVPADPVVRLCPDPQGPGRACEDPARQRLAGHLDPAGDGVGGAAGAEAAVGREELDAAGRAGQTATGVRRRLLAPGGERAADDVGATPASPGRLRRPDACVARTPASPG